MFEHYYCIKQHDITDCAAACIATIAKQYGLQMPIAKIREIAGTDKKGTNVYGVVTAAERLGFTVKAVKGDKEAFFSQFPLPCMAHVLFKGRLLHFVVIHEINNKRVVIADPGVGLVTLTPAEFFGEKSEDGNTSDYFWSGVLVFLTPSSDFKKGDFTVDLFSRFLNLLMPQKRYLIHVFVASILYTFLGILCAFYFRFLLDEILPSNLNKTLHIISIGIIFLYTFQVLLNAFRSHLMLYLSQKLDIALLLNYYRHVLSLPMNFFGTRRVGEIISRFTDASHVRDAISGATLTIMIDIFMVVVGGIILFNQNAMMFGVSLGVVLLYLIIVWSFNKWYKKLNKAQMEDNSMLTSYLVESLNGIQTIKAFNAEREANLETEKKFIALLKSVFKLSWVSNLQVSLKSFVEAVGGVVILWIGAVNVLDGNLTIGQLMTFNALLVYFLDPVKNLINLQPMIQTAIVAADRLGEILDLEPERSENEANKLVPSSLIGDVEMCGVTFRYGTRECVLDDISFIARKGEKIALVGESGSGKTTIAKLLLHMYTPEQGKILINDLNIQDIQTEVLRDRIAYVPQETFLFSGTIMENLMMGFDDIKQEELIEASKMAQAHDFINTFPMRYDTMLDENGSNLSGGQRQRLAITRAILKEPDIIILDEATSNLDSITERAIEETINKHAVGITSIIIAHRLSTIKRCDRIYVIDKGKVIESGTHNELIELRGHYYHLVIAQSLEDC